VLGLYPHWTEAARLAGDDWRVMSLDVQEQGTRNEQFIAAALGVETLAGFFGFAYPQAIARHAYCNDAPLDPELRRRRVGLLSVRYATVSEAERLRPRRGEERLSDPYPGGIDGTRIETIEGARPRAFLPWRVAAVVGDVETRRSTRCSTRRSSAGRGRVDRLRRGLPPTAGAGSFDAVVLVEGATLDGLDATDVTRVHLLLDASDRARLEQLAGRLSSPDVSGAGAARASFERRSSREVRVAIDEQTAARPGSRWLAALRPGRCTAAGRCTDAGRKVPVRGADAWPRPCSCCRVSVRCRPATSPLRCGWAWRSAPPGCSARWVWHWPGGAGRRLSARSPRAELLVELSGASARWPGLRPGRPRRSRGRRHWWRRAPCAWPRPRMRGREVVPLARVVLQVVQLGRPARRLDELPARVAQAPGRQQPPLLVALGVRDDEGPARARRGRNVQRRDGAHELGQRWQQVVAGDELGLHRAGRPRPARQLDDQRHADHLVVDRRAVSQAGVVDAVVLEEALAVVGDERDERAVPESGAYEPLADAADGMVGVGQRLLVLGAQVLEVTRPGTTSRLRMAQSCTASPVKRPSYPGSSRPRHGSGG
jgi:hypothetical protein